jgi:hypothetical protein
MVMPRGRALRNNLDIWEDPPLPALSQLYCGIYIRDSGNTPALEELADCLEADLREEPSVAEFEKSTPTVTPLRASGTPH